MTNRIDQFRGRGKTAALLAACVTFTACAAAEAQFPGPPGPPPPGPGHAIRIEVLKDDLNLSASQVSKIAAAEDSLAQHRDPFFGLGRIGPPPPPPGGPPDGPGPGFGPGRPGPDMVAPDVERLLNAKQQDELPALLMRLRDLGSIGIGPDVYGKLNLTDSQKTSLQTIARKTHDRTREAMTEAFRSGSTMDPRAAARKQIETAQSDAMAQLTDNQRAIVDSFKKSHHMRPGSPGPMWMGPGGPGGPGPAPDFPQATPPPPPDDEDGGGAAPPSN